MIDLTGKDKAEVLARLYNAADTQGHGALKASLMPIMSREHAQALLDSGQTYFDYVNGRVLKVDLSSDSLNERLYDRDNGFGAAAQALKGV